MCYRIPHLLSEDAEVVLSFNGQWLATIPAVSEWKTIVIAIPATLASEEFNELEIRWPLPLNPWQESVQNALHNLHLRRHVTPEHFYPSFGEISALFIQLAAGATGVKPAVGTKGLRSAGSC
jgi:hypothetical protein